jgi:hypothetical protein
VLTSGFQLMLLLMVMVVVIQSAVQTNNPVHALHPCILLVQEGGEKAIYP